MSISQANAKEMAMHKRFRRRKPPQVVNSYMRKSILRASFYTIVAFAIAEIPVMLVAAHLSFEQFALAICTAWLAALGIASQIWFQFLADLRSPNPKLSDLAFPRLNTKRIKVPKSGLEVRTSDCILQISQTGGNVYVDLHSSHAMPVLRALKRT